MEPLTPQVPERHQKMADETGAPLRKLKYLTSKFFQSHLKKAKGDAALDRTYFESPWVEYEYIRQSNQVTVVRQRSSYFRLANVHEFLAANTIQQSQVLATVSHPNIASIYGIYSYIGKLLVVTEHLDISLAQLDFQSYEIEEWEIATIVAEVLKGLTYISSKNISCQDLTTASVRLSVRGEIKLLLSMENVKYHQVENARFAPALLEMPVLEEIIEEMALPRYHHTSDNKRWSKETLSFFYCSISGSLQNLNDHPLLLKAVSPKKLIPRIRFALELETPTSKVNIDNGCANRKSSEVPPRSLALMQAAKNGGNMLHSTAIRWEWDYFRNYAEPRTEFIRRGPGRHSGPAGPRHLRVPNRLYLLQLCDLIFPVGASRPPQPYAGTFYAAVKVWVHIKGDGHVVYQNLHKSDLAPFTFMINGKSVESMLTTRNPALHKALRSAVASKYSRSSMLQLEPLFDKCMPLFVAEMDKRAGSDIDFGSWCSWYSFDLTGLLSFQELFGFMEQAKDINGVIESSWSFMSYGTLVGQYPYLHKYLLGNPCLVKFLDSISNANPMRLITETARVAIDKYDEKSTDLRDRDLINNILIFFVGAVNTNSASLRACFYYLVKTPDAYAKLVKELQDADARDLLSETLSFAEGQKLPYLQACIKESLRMYPIVGTPFDRVVPKGGAILSGHFVPEGTIVGISGWATQRDKEVFGDDAESFRPERWLDPDEKQIRVMDRSMLAFGQGTRGCVARTADWSYYAVESEADKAVDVGTLWEELYHIYSKSVTYFFAGRSARGGIAASKSCQVPARAKKARYS
ncbi:hypothetical protein V491_00907 [Pseudogymnoascus sp. VKM F-3775]|nr:hypothetical protein V491_00907 [Pseudogymnoascus sp. VKM F-3775]